MIDKKQLYDIIINNNNIKIISLKKQFTPVDLVTQLNKLIEEKLIEVDWDEGVIITIKKNKDLIEARNKLRRKKDVPDYMKTSKQEINKPYI
ncbi:hypothetical protein [Lutibacter sp.]|uniref:hypothetical protein n=1 Tax=Lutibacter sp. TaxID=1925666 RepID=UPI00356602AA